MNREYAWLSLTLIPRIGPVTISRLIKVFGHPENVLKAGRVELEELSFLSSGQLEAIIHSQGEDRVTPTLKALNAIDAYAISIDHEDYPSILREIHDPPYVLYARGEITDFQPAVAIVGTRAPSHYGREMAFTISRDLSMSGISIVSGLARGIDTEAHRGALEGKSKTVAVLGCGIDTIYPKENKALSEKIALQGCMISEFPPGTPPDAKNFPRRNRIISGLSLGIVVIEAAMRSGAMITARLAGEQGRMCMALPGVATNIRSKGPHSLIRNGATLVQDANDVLLEIAPQLADITGVDKGSHTGGDPLTQMMDGNEMSMEEIAEATGMDISAVAERLTMLELRGEIKRTGANRFVTRRQDG